jgi:hypothetical protein
MSEVTQKADYFNYVFSVVRNVIESREYKASIPDALKSINQYFPAVSYEYNKKAFENIFEVYLKSVDLIKKKEKKFMEYSQANRLDEIITEELNAFKKIKLPDETLRSMLQYIFYNKFQER